jgi:hypothetical protein
VAIHPATRLHRFGFLRRPRITVRFGPAIEHAVDAGAEREREQQAADRIWERIVALYRAAA